MPAINPVIFVIFSAVVGGLIVLSAITNLIGGAFGPWRAFAREFPSRTKGDQGEPVDAGKASMALTKGAVLMADCCQRPRGVGKILAILFTVWAVLVVGGILAAIFLGGAGMISMWRWAAVVSLVFWTILMGYWVVRFFRDPVYHVLVKYWADDEYLHLQKDSDVIVRYPGVSVPWAEVSEIHRDPTAPGWCAVLMGQRWAHCQEEIVEREVALRHAMENPEVIDEMARLEGDTPRRML